ncbi:MAG TPA: sulfotransferase [Candidatus Angelobacter sp.]|nr:sulfotransferase [Candidatus Angelobacter sp.]
MQIESSTGLIAPPEHSKPAGAVNLAYILSANFSGSTLLAMLLGSHPEAATVGEMRAPQIGDVNAYMCSCGEPIKKCPFWLKVNAGMARKGIADFDITEARISIHDSRSKYVARLLDPLPRGPLLEAARTVALSLSSDWRPHLQQVHARNVALVRVLQELTGVKLVIDSSKIAVHLKFLLRSPELKIKVIRLVRDGRAVTNSMLGHGLKRATRQETVAAAALGWRRNNEGAERVLADLPASQQKHLQYEQLCRQPRETLCELCDFLGLDPGRVVLDFRAKTQHVLGNEMRLKSGSDIRLDERWRTALTKEDLAMFEEVAGAMNRKYGYE